MSYRTVFNIRASLSTRTLIVELAGRDVFDGDEYKWYDHEEHCIQASSAYPLDVIVLDGEGEEQGDVWRKVFHGGKKIEEHRPSPWNPPEPRT